jgi:hypothetical protein
VPEPGMRAPGHAQNPINTHQSPVQTDLNSATSANPQKTRTIEAIFNRFLDQRLLFPGSNSMDVRSSMRAWAHCRTGCPLYFVSLRRHVRHWVSSWCWA